MRLSEEGLKVTWESNLNYVECEKVAVLPA